MQDTDSKEAENQEKILSEEIPQETSSKKVSVEEELKEMKDKYFRLLAELENTRKRLYKEKVEQLRFNTEKTISDFLPIIDNFEKALNLAEKSSEEVKNWAIGFHMFVTQLKELLQNQGIVSFSSEGTLFNPHLHEAVETHETEEHPEGLILQEFSRGYKSGERTLRPARVKVAKKPSLKEELTKKPEKE